MEKEKIIDILKNKSNDYKQLVLLSIDETPKQYIGWLGNPFEENQDLPILVLEKETGKINEVRIPPELDNSKEIWNLDNDSKYVNSITSKLEKMSNGLWEKPKEKSGGNDMEEKRIRDLLKQYGAADVEIENFMNDLNDDFNYLDYIDKLKLTEKGKDIIAKAPELKKDELKKLILDYLKEEE